ncbi:DUF2156 domain-containing protein [Hespellia stercorisuis]|uniref:Phosphatidylglycerol lysyltransferase C-terminal domain-containing protein n=1 Tax=Hespellia stercorisuis DSM 15480 TaxID=1121950 RepID=A0A1M6HW63_9FIRM|nr:phosphatidylglycerol lysyltransferase domain-containing protein [Hespellia stercorisuis]SHJ26462.1 hypothetical protein SAMN02745243_00176 [Hespellia stercorisuis DSM 15480]
MEKIEFKRPELEDKEIITSYFNKAPSRSCERTFINVYLWSRKYNVGYAIIEDTLVFMDKNQQKFAYPAGEPEQVKKALAFLIDYSKELGVEFGLYNVTPECFEQLNSFYPDQFQIEYERDEADYVYEREKLSTLAGKKLHGKRNHINKFKTIHGDNWSYESITQDNVEECFQMALNWRKENACDDDEEKNSEMCVTLNSLRLFRELEEVGGALRVDGKIVAFTLGEQLCDDTFVVHIEKAYADMDGAYPMINQQFVQHECGAYTYINREDDTGSAGLRKAKLSYRPVFMVEKGIASFR